MKIRQKFVSNSSSTSFIIKSRDVLLLREAKKALKKKGKLDSRYKSFPTVKEVTEAFLKAQINYYKYDDNDSYRKERIENRKELLKKLKETPDDLRYITFNACNYDNETFQFDEETILVFTCNNEMDAWREAIEKLEEKFNVIILEKEALGYIDNTTYYYYDVSSKADNEENICCTINYKYIEREGGKILLLSDPHY